MTVTPSPSIEELLDALHALPVSDLVITPETVGDDARHADLVLLEMSKAAVKASPSLGVSPKDLVEIRRVMLRAGYKGVTLHNTFTYTEGPLRWSGITTNAHDFTMTHGFDCDCSAFDTWLGKDATEWLKLRDFINGANWLAGYTGTMVLHGERVDEPQPTDFCFYGEISVPYHVAMSVGSGRVISMGRPGAPEIVELGAATQFRRYVL